MCNMWLGEDFSLLSLPGLTNQSDLLSSLCRDDDIKLINSVRWSRELSAVWIVGIADVRDDAVKHDVRVVDDWTHVETTIT